MSVARLTGVLLLFAVVNAVVVHRFGPANSQRRAASAASGSSWFARIVCPLNWSAVTRLQSTFSGVADATAAAAACVLTMTAQGSRETILELNCPDIVAAADLTSALRSNALLPPACTVLVEPNLIVTLAPPAQAQAQAQKRTVTDQPISLAGLWNLDRVDQRNLPLDAHYKSALNGSNVILYHFDTGARLTHTQFGGRATMLIDLVGDGTHTLGTAGGSTYGIARGATLRVVRVLDCSGSGSYSSIATGFLAIQDLQSCGGCAHPAVATLSLAGGISTIINNLVHDLVTSYHTAVVVAAGNNGGNACLLTPASATDALTVAATSADDSMPSWSNRGSCVDLAAPGNSILSAYYTGNSDTAVMSGTSMATPLVAGVVALELQRLVLAGTAVPSPALAMSNVVALATAAKINAGSGQHLALLYSNLGMPPPSPSPRAPVRSPSPRAPPPPPPLPPPAPRSRGGSLPVLGRGNAGDTVMPLAWFTSLLLIVVPIIFL